MFAELYHDEVGVAAHTGSAVHKVIELFHEKGVTLDQAIDDTKSRAGNFPRADWSEVFLHCQHYFNDTRNKFATVLASEQNFTTKIQEEKTGVELTISGTFDQIRLENGRKVLYDIKTSTRYYATELIDQHIMQLAAYWLGAEHLGIEVHSVGVLATYGYRRRGAELPSPNGVFVRSGINLTQAKRLMKPVFETVQRVRNGDFSAIPGLHCGNVCPAKNVETCLSIDELLPLTIKK